MSDGDRPRAPGSAEGAPRPETDAKRCSLILCTRNRPELLAEAVASVQRGDRVPDEILVIDQSDMPHPELRDADPAARGGLRYVHSDSRGLSRGMNEGIRLARYPLLVFTHDDVVVTPEWLGILVDALVEEGPGVVLTGQVAPSEAEEEGGFAPSTVVDPTPARYRGRVGQDVIYPLNMAMHREVLERVGPLDPRLGPGTPFPSSEDNDLCHRLLEAGYEIRYVPEAVLYHKAWRKRGDYLQLRWAYGRGQGAYYAKHLDLRDRYMARRFAHDIGQRFVRGARRWKEPLGALGELWYLAGLLSGAAQWLWVRRS